MAKQRQGRLICPVQVVEDQKHRLALARALEQVPGGGIEQIALCLGIARARRGQLGHALAQGGREPGEVAAVTLDVGVEGLLRRLLHEVLERLPPRLVGNAEILVAASVEHGGPLGAGMQRGGRRGASCRCPPRR